MDENDDFKKKALKLIESLAEEIEETTANFGYDDLPKIYYSAIKFLEENK